MPIETLVPSSPLTETTAVEPTFTIRIADLHDATSQRAANAVLSAFQSEKKSFYDATPGESVGNRLKGIGKTMVTRPGETVQRIGRNSVLATKGELDRAQLRHRIHQDLSAQGGQDTDISLTPSKGSFSYEISPSSGELPSQHEKRTMSELNALQELRGNVFNEVTDDGLREDISGVLRTLVTAQDGDDVSSAHNVLTGALNDTSNARTRRKVFGRKGTIDTLHTDIDAVVTELRGAIERGEITEDQINSDTIRIEIAQHVDHAVHDGPKNKAHKIAQKIKGRMGAQRSVDVAAGAAFVAGQRLSSRGVATATSILASPVAGAAAGAAGGATRAYVTANRDRNAQEIQRAYTETEFTGYQERSVSATHLLDGGIYGIQGYTGHEFTIEKRAVDEMLTDVTTHQGDLAERFQEIVSRINTGDEKRINFVRYTKGHEQEERSQLISKALEIHDALHDVGVTLEKSSEMRNMVLSHHITQETAEFKKDRRKKVQTGAIVGAAAAVGAQTATKGSLRLLQQLKRSMLDTPVGAQTPSHQPITTTPEEAIKGGDLVSGTMNHGLLRGNISSDELSDLPAGTHIKPIISRGGGDYISNELGTPIPVPNGTEWTPGSTQGAWDLTVEGNHTQVLLNEAHVNGNGTVLYEPSQSKIGEQTLQLNQPKITTQTTTSVVENPAIREQTWTTSSHDVEQTWHSANGSQDYLRTSKEGDALILDGREVDQIYNTSSETPVTGTSVFTFQQPGMESKIIVEAPGGVLKLDPHDMTTMVNVNGTPMSMHDLSGLLVDQNKLAQLPNGDIGSELNNHSDIFRVGNGTGENGYIEYGHVSSATGADGNTYEVLDTASTIHGTGTPVGIETHTTPVETEGPSITTKTNLYELTKDKPVTRDTTTTTTSASGETAVSARPPVPESRSTLYDKVAKRLDWRDLTASVLPGVSAAGAIIVGGIVKERRTPEGRFNRDYRYVTERIRQGSGYPNPQSLERVVAQADKKLEIIVPRYKQLLTEKMQEFSTSPLLTKAEELGAMPKTVATSIFGSMLVGLGVHIHGKRDEYDRYDASFAEVAQDESLDGTELTQQIQQRINQRIPHDPPDAQIATARHIVYLMQKGPNKSSWLATFQSLDRVKEGPLPADKRNAIIDILIMAYMQLSYPELYNQKKKIDN